MGLLERVAANVSKRQAWPLGPAVMQMGDDTWGHSQETFAPTVYGDYITSSNAIYACATLRARLLSSLPLLPYRLRPRKGKEAVTGGALVDLLSKVNPYWTMARLLQQTELSLCIWGQAYWFLERGKAGRLPPREIWWGRPDRVSPMVDAEKYITGYQYMPVNSSQPIEFATTEVIWFRYPNPLDEFSGLSPLGAARLAADYASAAMKANKNLFQHGLHLGGMISPVDKGVAGMMTSAQAQELEALIDKRFRGADNAHRWIVLRGALNVQGLSITPKDADYLGGLKESLEEICRAYGIPLDVIGGQRTFENYEASMRALWTQTMRPEAMFIASELTEQLLPMFPAGQGDLLEFDLSEVEELKEEETEAWTRWKEQIQAGARTINEWREEQGDKPVPWGDVFWASSTLKPIEDGEPEPPPPPPVIVQPGEEPKQLGPGEEVAEGEDAESQGDEGAEAAPEEAKPRAVTPQRQVIAYGSEQHRALWNRFVSRTDKQEAKVGETVAELFRRQEASIIARLRRRSARDIPDVAANPFDRARWIREFREAMRPRLRDVTAEGGQAALTDIGFGVAFDVANPLVTRFIEQRTQRFAREVNATTWQSLKDMLDKSIAEGEDLETIAKRVESIMGDRIASSKELIARTEVAGAANGGSLLAWEQAERLIGPMVKHWLASLDDRTRDDHLAAHDAYGDLKPGIPLEDNFEVGGASGPAPGQMGDPAQDIACRCTMTAEPAPF